MNAIAPFDAIPEDIRYIAQHVCGYVEAMPSEGNVNVIASAVMAERERCAQIAEAVDTKRGNEEFIAHAIRNPHSLPPRTPGSESPEVIQPASGEPTRADGGANITMKHLNIAGAA